MTKARHMHMRNFILLVIVLALTGFRSAAQGSTITGQVQDANSSPLAAATVSLMRGDTALVKVAVTNKTGHFDFSNIREGKYTLHITSVGFALARSAPFELAAAENMEVPVIKMTPAASGMQAVTVQARRPLIENKIDKMVVNVDASPTNAGATALEVLEKSPGITVDRDGNISLKGKQGIIVLMDGKQTYLSGADLANLLRNMPSSQLDQIEIMTQPSAKYDASGNSGIINLRTKKNLQMGFNGNITLSYVQGRYAKTPNSFSFNYRNGKVNFFTNLSYSYWRGFSELTIKRKFRNSNDEVTSVFDQEAMQTNRSKNYSARFGMDYSIDKKTTVGFMVNGIYNIRSWGNEGRADIFNGAGVLDSFNIAHTTSNDNWQNYGGNVNFRRQFARQGRELTADVDYIRYYSKNRQFSDNFNYDPQGNELGASFLLRGVLPSDISIYSGKIDYVHPMEKGAKLEAGLKSSFVTTDNDAQYSFYDHGAGAYVVDNRRSNHFLYEENINAAYINYSRQVNKWGFQGGLRVENTIATGDQLGNAVQKDTSFKKNYTQLFPTAFISYAMNEKNQFGLSYGRRIERPNYQDMNPFQYFLDQYTYRQGNPNLTPQFTHNIELSHNYAGRLNTTLNFTATTDILNDILKQDDATKVTFQTRENVARRQTIGLAISYNAPLTKWWSTSLYFNVNRMHYEGIVNNRPLDVAMVAFMGNMSQQFRFAKTWNAEINGFYRSRSQETGLFLAEPMGVVSFGFGKNILNNKGTIKLNVIDPFYIQKFRVNSRFGNIDAEIRNQWDNRRVGLTFTYRFSKGQNVQARRRTSSSQDEQNRIGAGSGQQ